MFPLLNRVVLYCIPLPQVARRSGAQALHPGYGFLADSAQLASSCAASNVTFIGPSAAVLTTLASKRTMKETLTSAGVPTLPGYHGESQNAQALHAEADKLGSSLFITCFHILEHHDSS